MNTQDSFDDFPDDHAEPRPHGRIRAAVLALVVIALLGCAGWFAWGAIQPRHTRAAQNPAGAGASRPAPPPPAPPSGSTLPLAGKTVLIDPGHNPGNTNHPAEINSLVGVGNGRKECDTTGTETAAGYTEAQFTLDVARRARALLRAEGAKVVFTQDGDLPWGPCVDRRAAIGNEAHADAAVSVHADGGPDSGSGFHVILPAKVVAGGADTSAIVGPSRTLGLDLQSAFRSATGEHYADYLAGGTGLDTRSDLGGLNLSRVPKVFIECGNMRNDGDASRLSSAAWRQSAARGLADGLTRFLRSGA